MWGPGQSLCFLPSLERVTAHAWVSMDERMKERMVEKHPGSSLRKNMRVPSFSACGGLFN